MLRTGSHEMVVVQAQDPDGGLLQDVALTIRIFDFPARRQLLSEAAATLSLTGSFLAKAMVQVRIAGPPPLLPARTLSRGQWGSRGCSPGQAMT